MLGVAKACDVAELETNLPVVSGLAPRMLDFVRELRSLVPAHAPADEFTAIAHQLEHPRRRRRVP
jgi:hypothetical protein